MTEDVIPSTMTLGQIASGVEGSEHPSVTIDPGDLSQHRLDIFGPELPQTSAAGHKGADRRISGEAEAVVSSLQPHPPTRRSAAHSGPVPTNN